MRFGSNTARRLFGCRSSGQPWLPEDVARAVGYDPALCKEGKLFEAATLGCVHCGAHVVVNPLRTRERGTCYQCNYAYICDVCVIAMQQPDYVHRTVREIIDLLDTGRWALSGSMSRPILTPLHTGN